MSSRPTRSNAVAADWTGAETAAYLLQPLRTGGWRSWLAPLLAAAVLAAALYQLSHISLAETLRLVPHSPAFWLLFAVWYLIQPASEWVIFRRLWRIPATGFLALLRKRISNEILLGYSGEVYFYGWARRHAHLVGAPFGAVKDVAILSAAAGNATTLLLLAVSWPLLGNMLHMGLRGDVLVLSIGTVALSSVATFAWRRSIFSLPAADIRHIAVMHLLRIVGTTILAAALWEMALPSPILWLLVLSTLRMLISRLPFVPNKDVIFAGVAVLLMGRNAEVTDLLAMMAGLILVTHLLLGAVLAASELVRLEDPA